ncbi:MAG: TIGR00730 family Rossman fold protein [Rhodospirillales bacterium]|nr:TIGR00730 family Rossman fold protein [Alphaproteobacteria bacterium]MCB9986567.1 TIGR00730 family Rossman fold protein [Rhodospirillales bacterium]USO06900.1 MAG: TIGR00730 family Rossman fold protein [Rhodospirillales bacterium]
MSEAQNTAAARPFPKISSVCVYLGSSGHCAEHHKKTAHDFGQLLAQAGMTLVYGGGRVGLMGILADSVLQAGGKVIGIIPEHISKREVSHVDLTELHVVDSMHTRKQMMVDKSDAFVVLPGGIGTLDELCEVMTWKQLGIHDKPIVIANVNDYWTPFIKMIDNVIGERFMREDDRHLISEVGSIADVITALTVAPVQTFDPSSKWI